MSSSTISTYGLQLLTTSNLFNQQQNLATLNEQLGSGQVNQDLTNYSPVDAQNILDFQSAITQRQAYISGMQTVSTRLSIYDSTMTDMENITQQAETLASSNQTYNAQNVAQINAQAQAYLQQMEDDLNQQVGNRYIYSGTNYSVAPVGNLTALGAPTVPFTPTSSPALPDYSSEYSTSKTLTVSANPPTGNFQIGNTTIKWSDLAAGTVSNVYVNGVATPVTVSGLTTPATTPAELASNLSTAINQIVANDPSVTAFANMSASASGATVTLGHTGNPAVITPDSGGIGGETTWGDGTDGSATEIMATTDAGAFAQDSVTLDAGFSVQYGVTSNAPGFQQVIAGLRLLNAASAQTDPTTYSTEVSQAITLLNSGLSNIQAVHASVAGNTNLVTQETNTQNTDISNLQNQLGNIQNANLTQVGTEINTLQTQLQASYSATATILQDSILKYL